MDRFIVRKIFFNEVVEVKSKVFNSLEDAKTYYNLCILPYALSNNYFVERDGNDFCSITGANSIEISLGIL